MKLEGKFFRSHVENGDKVKKGDPLLSFDKAGIEKEGYDTVTPVVVLGCDDNCTVILESKGKVEPGERIFEIR